MFEYRSGAGRGVAGRGHTVGQAAFAVPCTFDCCSVQEFVANECFYHDFRPASQVAREQCFGGCWAWCC